MKKIILKLDYHCFPTWNYNDTFIENNLIDELKYDQFINETLVNIQNTYDALFINNEIEFSYKGFSTSEEKASFIQQIDNLVLHIKEKLGNQYIVENAINYDEL